MNCPYASAATSNTDQTVRRHAASCTTFRGNCPGEPGTERDDSGEQPTGQQHQRGHRRRAVDCGGSSARAGDRALGSWIDLRRTTC